MPPAHVLRKLYTRVMNKYTFPSEAAKQARLEEVLDMLSSGADRSASERDALRTELAVLTDDIDYLETLPPESVPSVEVTESRVFISPRANEPSSPPPPKTDSIAERVKSGLYTTFGFLVFLGLPAVGFIGCIFGVPGGCVPDHEVGTRLCQPSELSTGGLIFESMEARALLESYRTSDDGEVLRQSWSFSVADRACYDVLHDAMLAKQLVVVHYRKYLIRPWSQDRKYVVFKVEPGPLPQSD
ncbi:hypothetical protein LBMAG48_26990 [Phycisphaerae bacterium]|nr:hypothetical protein LBMAG48_26990 [Phycisphaerae bacterium]